MQEPANKDFAPRPPRVRLARRIALGIAAGALLMTAALTVISMRLESRLATGIFTDGSSQVTELSAASLGGAVRFGKTEIVEERLIELAEANAAAFAGAAVFDAEGQPLARAGASAETAGMRDMLDAVLEDGRSRSADGGLLQVMPVRFGRDASVVGALAVHWTDAPIAESVRETALWLVAAGLTAALFMAGLAIWALNRTLAQPLDRLEKAIGRMIAGENIDIPGFDRRDEIGALARSMHEIHAQGEAAARTRRAIDSSSAMLMIADDQDRIAYVSPTLVEALRKARDAIRKRMPAFDPDRLQGQDIHVFHMDDAEARSILRDLTGTHRTEITLGERRLRLVISPIRGADGARLGTVVEWTDRTEDLALLAEIDRAAAGAADGDFSGRVAPNGADPSLEQVAQQVNRICRVVDAFLADIDAPMTAMARGDLGQRSSSSFDGRLADVANNVNATLDKLSETVRDIKRAEASMRDSIAQVSDGAGDLSSRTEGQASALEETSATVEEISATVSANADSAREASRMAASATDKAEAGRKVVSDAVTSMQEIEESSSRINDITAVIDSIAFQTNLLALNAAVEAARAGEAGKGFAVVASEVRALAQRSSEAARDIKELIAASGDKVADGVRHVNATGDSLGDLTEAIQSISQTIDDIARASAEQATGMQEITSAVSHMDETTQRNASLAEESARAAAELRAQSDTLGSLIGFFIEEAGAAGERAAA